jgi:hypothetical protein
MHKQGGNMQPFGIEYLEPMPEQEPDKAGGTAICTRYSTKFARKYTDGEDDGCSTD